MKVKPLYIYLIAIIVAILAIILISSNNTPKVEPNTMTENMGKQMPDDEVHRGLKGKGGMAPSKDNVNKEAIHQFEMLKKAYESNPNDTMKAKAYAEMLAAGHQPEKALSILEGIHAKDNKRIDVLLLLTSVSYNLKMYDKAELYTKKILAIDKDNGEANYNLGAIYAQQGKKDEARKIWENIVKKYPNSDASKYATMGLNKLK